MTTASLALLKGKSKIAEELDAPTVQVETPKKTGKVSLVKKPAAEQPAPIEEPTVAEAVPAEAGEVTIDVDTMNTKQIDALVEEQKIETPEGWAKMTLAKKKAWLNANFGDGEPANDDNAVKEPVAETKAVAPVGKSSKASAKDLEGQVLAPDALSDMVHEIENLKEKDARELVGKMLENTELTFFKLGGVLSLIQANAWFAPHASFKDYVEHEHGIEYRKATYFVGIYNNLTESQIPWEKVKSVGWTKLKEIAGIITLDNVDDWVKLAGQQTTLQLIDTVKAHKKAKAGQPLSLEDQSSKTVTTKTFKVHEDQKVTIEAAIDKAKEISGTSVDTAALEFICLEYLGNAPKAQSLDKQMDAAGLDAVCEALEKAFPNVNFTAEITDEAAAA